jgi:hypothetical protein
MLGLGWVAMTTASDLAKVARWLALRVQFSVPRLGHLAQNAVRSPLSIPSRSRLAQPSADRFTLPACATARLPAPAVC